MPSFSQRQSRPLHLHVSSYCVSITKYCLSATLLFDLHKTEENILIVVRVFSTFIMLIGAGENFSVGKNRYKCKNIPTLWSAIIGAPQDLQLILKPIQTPSLRVEINNNNRPKLELART